jgi:hypothetical protein
MAMLPTLLAVLGGIGLGLLGGGRLDNVARWHPRIPALLTVGLSLELVLQLATMRNDWTILVELEAAVSLLVFAWVNRRTGGMVLVALGLLLNLAPTVVNWGIPTEPAAAERAGVIHRGTRGIVELDGPRHLATGDDHLRWLDERIALPTGQVISIGDVVLHAGYVLTIAAVLRRRKVRRGASGARGYGTAIAPLGRGPAPRKGPGLHPSRMGPAGIPRGPMPEPVMTRD